MKKIFHFPRITVLSMALMLSGLVIVISQTSCKSKSVYGTKSHHKAHKRSSKGMAPSMGG